MLVDDLVKPKEKAKSKFSQPLSYRPGIVIALVLIALATLIYVYQNRTEPEVRQGFPPDLNALDRRFTGENKLTAEQIKERDRQLMESGNAVPEISLEQKNLRDNYFDTND